MKNPGIDLKVSWSIGQARLPVMHYLKYLTSSNKWIGVFLPLLFIASRLIFAHPGPVFFDSPEYLERMQAPSFSKALTTGHTPLHSGYLILAWPLYQLGGANVVIFVQIFLNLAGIIALFKVFEFIFDRPTALLASILVSLLPLVWVTQVTIMMESVYVPLFWIGLYSLLESTQTKTSHWSFMAVFSLSLSLLTHLALLVWLPFIAFFILIIFKRKKLFALTLLTAAVILGVILGGTFISLQHESDLAQGVGIFLFGKTHESADISLSLISLARIIRNTLLPLFANQSILFTLITGVALIWGWFRSKQKTLLLLCGILPVIVVNQWWDSLFFGRHALLASYISAAAAAWFVLNLRRFKVFSLILISYLVLVSLPALSLLNLSIPYLKLRQKIATLPASSLVIASHFERPQLQDLPQEFFFVEEPGYSLKILPEKIDQSLNQDRPVFVTGHALTEPYGLFSGPYIHSLSLSYRRPPVLKSTLNQYALQSQEIIAPHDNLVLYSLSASPSASYPKLSRLNQHYRRLNHTEPLQRLLDDIVN